MELTCRHLSCRTTDLAAIKDFYAGALGLDLLLDTPHMIVLKAGGLRLSFFAGFDRIEGDAGDKTGMSLILATNDLDATMKELEGMGIEFIQEIQEAPGFLRFTAIRDPDGSVVFIGQYLTDQV